MQRLTVVGAGLAGCEAAWQAAKCGVEVDLYEMRPHKSGPAHKTGALAELVCSNSLRGAALENAVGLLKEELARLDSIVVTSAREAAVPAGGALAVDRERFAAAVQSRIASEPRIALHREEVTSIPAGRPVIVACGPLPSEELLQSIRAALRQSQGDAELLHYYDAASPIVAADSLDETQTYRKSRYDKGDGDDYVNVPLDREQYLELVNDLRTLERHQPKDFETDAGTVKYFEGCLPIEEMADRGDDVLRFGPLKPVGLRDPRTGKAPYAVVQLRKENVEATAYNLVGFQTRLSWPAQKIAFGKLPGLQNAEWLRLGVMHR
ncbi:MAG TPA: methylenetetrahydrofolate--tRNA-(uracil(54)-C(5))-methyltransferase (FADH(2)-oxidizing) TrmFO, partial [Candidatus Baltobacteraceae bacterium]|nr:methylenetetrahydrofolate--tRNA-(uracil(54)-C(5))-methyltransferase (FADH(2)-oxidizing) TrmFO [Candidatus Baltobacteraceae bacterium]